jgi:nonsense-mediated mRNA decay protein 3
MMGCVECGAQVPRLIGGSCPACFVKKTPLARTPATVDVEVCAHCDARHVGAHWIDPDAGAPLEWVREEAARASITIHPAAREPVLSLEEQPLEARTFRIRLHLDATVEGTPVSHDGEFLLRVKRGVCDRCSRMVGGYYAAILQMRATDRPITPAETERVHRLIGDELDRLRANGNRDAFLTKSGPVPGGFDYYLGDIEGTRAIARTVADRMGASVEEHAKLVGRQGGEDVYRVTFLVRIRWLAPGDFVVLGEKVYQFVGGDRGRAHLLDLERHTRTKVDEAGLRRVGGLDDLRQAVLVSQDAGGLQILDPVDLRTVEVPRPEGFFAPNPTVWVLRHEERLYLPQLTPPEPPTPKKRVNV